MQHRSAASPALFSTFTWRWPPCVIGYGEIGVRLAASRLAPARFDGLARTFGQAARLKAAFWDMGLTPAG